MDASLCKFIVALPSTCRPRSFHLGACFRLLSSSVTGSAHGGGSHSSPCQASFFILLQHHIHKFFLFASLVFPKLVSSADFIRKFHHYTSSYSVKNTLTPLHSHEHKIIPVVILATESFFQIKVPINVSYCFEPFSNCSITTLLQN